MSSQALGARPRDDGKERTAVYIVLAAEAVFFGTLILSCLYLRVGQYDWPFNHPTLSQLTIPALNTAILLLSGVSAWGSERAILGAREGRLRLGLIVTLLLGLVFVAGQVFEFNRAGMRPSDQAFGGVFFALMGFHALHVLAGIVILAINLVRAFAGDFSPARHMAVSLGSWFWYFVVAVWLVLFAALFLI